MTPTIRVSAQNGLLFLHDAEATSGPEVDGQSLVYTTADGVAITVASDEDVVVRFGDCSGLIQVWAGTIATGSLRLHLTNVAGDVLHELQVDDVTTLELFADHDVEAEVIAIGIRS